MNSIYRDIFQAVHEGKWLSIEYRNIDNVVKKYWIAIHNINVHNRTLSVEGLHLSKYTVMSYDKIFIDSIISSEIVDGTYYPVNKELIEDIYLHPHKYAGIFDNVANMKILTYLEECNKMDATPYKTNYNLVKYLDNSSFNGREYLLNREQFERIVTSFQYKSNNTHQQQDSTHNKRMNELCMNVLSINMPKGLYVLAYRKLKFDIKKRTLLASDDISICWEYTIDGNKESIRQFLDADEYELLVNFEKNSETIKDCIQKRGQGRLSVDDMPYIIVLGMDSIIDLHKEYNAIIDMFKNNEVSIPIRAFFGELLNRPVRKKSYPIALVNKKINLDQLLAINNAMKFPLAYVQGPPGTGKTNTIINTLSTAFFNDRTVLFTSYNNHPIDSVFDKLTSLKYKNKTIPLPIIRLGNKDKLAQALDYISDMYDQVKDIAVYEKTLDKNKDDRIERAKKLAGLLKKYEDILDYKERSETLGKMIEYNEKQSNTTDILPFQLDLTGQKYDVDKYISQYGNISENDALSLLNDDEEDFMKYLYYTSVRIIKKINEPKNEDLRGILEINNKKEKQVMEFTEYLSNPDKLRKFIKIFPIVITTCLSAHKLGKPESYFDMVVIDEASQCNTAISLVPIIRGDNLLLVGDPQQLNPVIMLSQNVNERLKKKYTVSEEYDYCKNSIYKTYLACDSVSDEILLHNHYRCNKKIIQFNNKKYYNSKLSIKTQSNEPRPLVYVNVTDSTTNYKNTAPMEAQQIAMYAANNRDKSIGVITPFVNQKKLIEQMLKEKDVKNVTVGTVHAFQGDEKDIVLFSTAITDKTVKGTYDWLKNNKELINVATSRAREKLIVLSSTKNLLRLHDEKDDDDLYELVGYVKSNGTSTVTQKSANSRALGVKPYSTKTEEAFLENLNHAMGNIWLSQNRFIIRKEVGIAHVFEDNNSYNDLFYTGRFDFVVYEKKQNIEEPVLAIELDGKEHFSSDIVKERDKQKNAICRAHNFTLIRIENSYARRYNYIKDILFNYFKKVH